MNKYITGVTTGIVVGALIILALYFFWHLPEVQNAADNARQEVLSKPPVVLEGDTIYIYKTKTKYIEVEKPVEVVGDVKITKFDTTYQSLGDTISINAVVEIDSIAQWFMNIEHKHTETFRVDTLKHYIKETLFVEPLKTTMDKIKDFSFWVLLLEVLALGVYLIL